MKIKDEIELRKLGITISDKRKGDERVLTSIMDAEEQKIVEEEKIALQFVEYYEGKICDILDIALIDCKAASLRQDVISRFLSRISYRIFHSSLEREKPPNTNDLKIESKIIYEKFKEFRLEMNKEVIKIEEEREEGK